MSQQNILVVDDEPDIRNLVQEILIDEGYRVRVAENTKVARKHASAQPPDLVLLDIWMPDEDGISLLKDWQGNGTINCPVVMMSGHGTVETAVEATRLGAYDFIEKPLTMAKLLASVKRALEDAHEKQDAPHLVVEEPIGSSPQTRVLREQAKKLARHNNVLLLVGESGVGKKTFASYVHSIGANRGKPFIEASDDHFNTRDGAKELFGVEADDLVTPGMLELYRGGTLYIDDVANINNAGQKLLSRLLQRNHYYRMGGRILQKLDMRVVGATRCDLQTEVKANRFDDELYFCLNIIPIRIAALREHLQDVPELLRHYIDVHCAKENYPYRSFSIAAQNRLLHYTWPENIRELKNLVQKLLILSSAEEISAKEVGLALNESALAHPSQSSHYEKLYQLPLREARETFERDYLLHQLKQVDGSISKLAERVKMERTHLYRKLRTLGINTKEP